MIHALIGRAGLLAFVGALLMPLGAYAQVNEGIGVRITPTLIEERVEPGTSVAGTVTVTNTSAFAQEFNLVTRNVTHVDTAGRPTFSREDADTEGTLAAWITLTERSISLASGESARVGYTVLVPEDAPPGTHFGGVFVDRRADRLDTSGAGVGYMVGALMSIQAGGEVVERLQIREFSTDRSLYTAPEPEFLVRIENQGNIYEEVQGLVTITDMFGNTVETVTLDPFRAVPEFERETRVRWEGGGLHIGRYTALLSVVHGQESRKTVTREVSFWILPLGQIGAVLAGLIVFLLVLYIMVRMYVRKQLAQAGYRATARAKSGFMQKLSTLLISFIILAVLALVGVLLFFS